MNRLACKKQRNYCALLMRENKKQNYDSLNVNRIRIIKTSREQLNQTSQTKQLVFNRVILKDDGKIMSDTEKGC